MAKKNTTGIKTLDMVYMALFAIVLTVCSWIAIPAAVPFSLQTFGVFLTVGVLGGKRGTFAIVIYLLLGIMGVPVFTGFRGGIGVLYGATGGYIVGFLLAALSMWALEAMTATLTFGRKWLPVVSMGIGLSICYIFGTIWFMVFFAGNRGEVGVWTALTWCVFPFVIPDIIKIAAALSVRRKLIKIFRM